MAMEPEEADDFDSSWDPRPGEDLADEGGGRGDEGGALLEKVLPPDPRTLAPLGRLPLSKYLCGARGVATTDIGLGVIRLDGLPCHSKSCP